MAIFEIIFDEDYPIIIVFVLYGFILIEKRMYFYIVFIDLDDDFLIFLSIKAREIL